MQMRIAAVRQRKSRPKLRYCHRLPPHSHSIVLSDDNALIYRRKFIRPIAKNRLPDPSKICAPDFKREFSQSATSSVSATIDLRLVNVRSLTQQTAIRRVAEKYRQRRLHGPSAGPIRLAGGGTGLSS